MTDLLEKLILLPSPAYVHLIRYILLGATLTFLAYTGLVLGGSILSVSASLTDRDNNRSFPRNLSQRFMEASLLSPFPLFLLVLLPLMTAGLISTSLFHLTMKLGANLWPGVLLLAFSASVLLLLYKAQTCSVRSALPVRLLLGGGGSALLLLAYLLVIIQTGGYMNTELWQFSDDPLTFFLTWNNAARFGLYFMLALAAAGSRLLQIMYGGNKTNTPQEELMVNTAKGITLAALFLLPPLVVADIYTLPVAALNGTIYVTGACTLFLPWATALILLESFRNRRPGTGTVVLILILLTFLTGVTLDHVGREQATVEKIALLQKKREVQKPAPVEAETPVEKKEDLLVAGEAVFKKVCTACHRFDARLVGPPYNTVVPKYRGKINELKAFIRNPDKRDPAYPAMPKLGLKEKEIHAVAVYLLEHTRELP